MRVTTVASVTEQNNVFRKKIENSYYKLYSIATPSSTPPYTIKIPLLHPASTITYETQQPTRTEHLPKNETFDKNSHYKPYSIATSSFTPRYALVIPFPHFIATKSIETQ